MKSLKVFLLLIILSLGACTSSTQVATPLSSASAMTAISVPTTEPNATSTAVPIPPIPALNGTAGPSLPTIPFQNKVYQQGNTYIFEYADSNTTIRYTYLPTTGSLHDLQVRINDEAPFYPSNYGGPYFVDGNKEIPIWQASSRFQISPSQPVLDANGLQITWNATSSKHTISYSYHFSISGKTLQMDISSDTTDISKFDFDRSERTLGAQIINIPYLTTINLLLFNNDHFMSVYFDWTRSQASDVQSLNSSYSNQSIYFGQTADYLPNTNNVRNPIHETAYITVSNSLHEVLPSIPNPPSPYKEVLAGRVVLDFWDNPFAQDTDLLNQLKKAGITDNILVIKHDWQKCGYDNCYPNVIPANPDQGGDAGLLALSNAAHDAGYLFALHENYVDFYQNSSLWDSRLVALDSNGAKILAWYNPGPQEQSYLLSPIYALKFAPRFSPWIHQSYGTTASFLDVSSAIMPSYKEDYNADIKGSAEMSTTFNSYSRLFAYERLVHNGPVLGEGNNHFMWVGLIDGVEAQVGDGNYTAYQPIVDFDLLKIHPLAVNHGMGYYERYFGGDNQQTLDLSGLSVNQYYNYMATEIAFCHAGFVSSPERLGNYQWLTQVQREVKLVLPIQQHCAIAKSTQILYNVDGNMVGVEQAIIKNDAWQVYVSYDSGLQIYVNRDPSQNWTITPSSTQSWVDYHALVDNLPKDYVGDQTLSSYTLPPNGWLALMP